MVGVLYTELENIALVRDIRSVSRNTARQYMHEWETQECGVGQEQEARTIL